MPRINKVRQGVNLKTPAKSVEGVRHETTTGPAWLPELEKWEHAEYDGIKGSPPDWVPAPDRRRFCTHRYLLFNAVEQRKASYPEIKSRFDTLVADKRYKVKLAVLKDEKPYDDSLHDLVKLYKAISLKEIEGLRSLAGDDAVAGFRSRTAFMSRDEYHDRPDVQNIGKEEWKKNPRATIAEIIRSPKLGAYRIKYTGRHTLRDWLSPIDPRPAKAKRGRPSKK